jgi:hypothetical protein
MKPSLLSQSIHKLTHDERQECYQRAYNALADQDKQVVDALRDRIFEQVKVRYPNVPFSPAQATELAAALGAWISKNG